MKTPLERIGVTGPNRQDARRNSVDSQRDNIRNLIAESNAPSMESRQQEDFQRLIESLPQNIDMGNDFSSLQQAGDFIDDLKSRRSIADTGVSRNGMNVGAPRANVSDGRLDTSNMDPNLAWLIGKESSGRANAQNPHSTAFGIGQLIKANREHYGAQLGFDPNTQDPQQQLDMMLAYIRDRHGSVAAARQFWEQNGWY